MDAYQNILLSLKGIEEETGSLGFISRTSKTAHQHVVNEVVQLLYPMSNGVAIAKVTAHRGFGMMHNRV